MKLFCWKNLLIFVLCGSLQAVTSLNDHQSIASLSVVEMPIDAVTDSFTKSIFATIDVTFGKTGIGMDASQIIHLKKTYLYLIFLTKVAKVQRDVKYQQYKTDFAPYLKDNKTSLPHVPSVALVTSVGWGGVQVTAQDLQNSTAWQLYIKTMICDIYVYFSTVLGVIHNVEKQMFNYIPHFETSFYNKDFTNLATLNEMARTRLVIEESLKQRWKAQCIAWSTLPTVDQLKKNKNNPAKNVTAVTLESEVVAFRATAFYKTIRDAHAALGIDPNQQNGAISNEQMLSAPKLSSPLKEQVWCYYMLYEASGQITSFMTEKNLGQVLNVCFKSKLIPNIFPYTPDDYVLLDELIAVQDKVKGTHTNSIHPSPKSYEIDKIIKPECLSPEYQKFLTETTQALAKSHDAEVVAQMWSLFKDIGHDFSKAYSDVKSSVEAGFDAVKNFAIAAGQGIAGLGAIAVGFVAKFAGDSSISNWGKEELNREEVHFKKATTELSTSIDDFADAIKDGIVAPIGEVTGDLAGFILDDQKLGQDISTVVDNVADTLVQLAGTYTDTLIATSAEAVNVSFKAVQVTEQLAVVVGDAAWAIFSDKGRQQFLKQGEDLGKECVDSIAQAYSTYSGIDKAAFEAVLTGLGVIVNAITTIFIDLSREITYLFSGGIFNVLRLSDIPGFTAAQVAGAYGKEQAAHVTSVLNDHRSTMNMVLGIVACIAADAVVDVSTAGAGTAADAGIDAAIMGATETASAAASDAAGVAAETAAEQTAAETGAAAAQQALNAAKSALEELPEDASEQTEQAAKNLVDQATSKLNDAQKVLSDATSKAEEAAQKAKTLEKAAQDAAQKVADKAVQDSKSFVQKAQEYASKYVKDQIKSIKNLTDSIPKALANLSKSSDELMQDATENLSSKEQDLQKAQEALADIADTDEDAAAEKEVAQKAVDDARAEVKEAQSAVDDLHDISNESKLGKLKRYGKNALKTLGTALKPVGMIMNVTFNMGSIVGSANQDAKNSLNLETQTKTLNNLWKFNNENKISVAQQSLAYLEEMEQKTQAQVGNQALGLTISQNSINANILALREAMALPFASLYAQLLTPNPATNLLLANIGTSWKLKTDYLDLYPSQGFFTTTTGRKDFPFAQEIAQAPNVTNLMLSQSKGKEKFWFNQRCTARDIKTTAGLMKKPTDPLLVQADIQFLYTLNSDFHVGLYLGGNYHDYAAADYMQKYFKGITIAQAQAMLFGATATGSGIPAANMNSSIIDFDEAHLAKMVVLYRDSATSALMLGVYEHEGLGWLVQEALADEGQLDQQHVYTLQAVLDGTSLKIKLFIDGKTEPVVNKTLQVTKLNNYRTYGMICSGAAIEWNQISPKPMIVTTPRPKNTKISNQSVQEQNNKIILAAALAPKFGTFNLTPLSKQAILQGQYLYASTQTDLKKILSDSPIDFVMFGIEQTGQLQLGVDAQTALANIVNARLISVINGTIYDSLGNSVGHVSNAWVTYQQSVAGPFPEKLDTFIKDQQAKIETALSHVNFGESWMLAIVNPLALQNGQYIYTCLQTLKDATGKAIIDSATGKPMIDYLVCANYQPTSQMPLTIGMPPISKTANALFSFVTGNIYAKNAVIQKAVTVQPLSTSYQNQRYEQFGMYAARQQMTTDPIYGLISTAQASYATYQASAAQTATASDQSTNIQPTNVASTIVATQDHFSKAAKVIFTGSTVGYLPHAPGIKLSFGGQDLDQRQKSAAGTAGYQLYGVKKGIKLSFAKRS